MTQSYLCTPPPISDNKFDNWLRHQEKDHPCCLTLDDLLKPHCQFEFPQKRFFSSNKPPVTSEPQLWAEVLFDSEDIIEIRLLPSRLDHRLRPLQFCSRKTAVRHGLNLFPFASGIGAAVNQLHGLNRGAETLWGKWNNEKRKWFDVVTKVGLPLNVYCGINPRFASDCTKNDDVICARCLVADLDKTSLDEALTKFKTSGLPPPSMTVLSGHGVHFYWRLTKPIVNLANWTAIQKRLIQLVGSDPAIHDPARVIRVPGFQNLNRVTPVDCRIHEAHPDRRYELNELIAFLPSLPTEQRDRPSQTDNHFGTANSPLRLQVPSTKSTLKRADACAVRFQPADQNRNSTLFGQACDLHEKFDLNENEVHSLIEKSNDKASNPLDSSEVEEVVSKAIKHIQKKGKQRGTLLQPSKRIETYAEPSGTIIKLEEWREEMKTNRLGSIGQQNKVFFDGSPCGAGKSTADLAAMKVAGKSATFLPTHNACRELATKLKKENLSAGAHPQAR